MSRHVNVELSDVDAAALDESARLSRSTNRETARRAFRVYFYLEQVARDGGRIKITDEDGKNPREIVILT